MADIVGVLDPSWQIDFSYRLEALRQTALREALNETMGRVSIVQIDRELEEYVPAEDLQRLAAMGLRGERVFAVPALLAAQPSLLMYYRLLYGLSQKACYGTSGPLKAFAAMEQRGIVTEKARPQLPALCRSLSQTARVLVRGVEALSMEKVQELQLLTLGASFDGSRRNTIGQEATDDLWRVIREVVEPFLTATAARWMELQNSSQRKVQIVFAADPDIRITEQSVQRERPLVAIEIKGGTDPSNIYNRLGEAEKSHLKAKAKGYSQFWTIVGVDLDLAEATAQSPTTTSFYAMHRLVQTGSSEHRAFCDALRAIIGLPDLDTAS